MSKTRRAISAPSDKLSYFFNYQKCGWKVLATKIEFESQTFPNNLYFFFINFNVLQFAQPPMFMMRSLFLSFYVATLFPHTFVEATNIWLNPLNKLIAKCSCKIH